ncbi:hypothetical protein ACFQY4_26135 [Catellatospora bangladeshensis]|uniref:PE-PGRS family protein n=1 Tax=Catellatospora bangladeshensis TaxID=310355 RepID=A0A8J3JVZ7_9ACTN|nr:hypothetical protein Cba03nite_74070 [Catellatospora bangladeshensis]
MRTAPGMPTSAEASVSSPEHAVDNVTSAFAGLIGFLHEQDLTTRIRQIEERYLGVTAADVAGLAEAASLSPQLLHAALLVRQHTGRINDLIHAAVIAQALPLILEAGERVDRRPSLASGNDDSRRFDLQTDRRVAEFKVSQWKGKDSMRKRMVFADLVNLAMHADGLRAQLYVTGPRPIRYLRTATSSALAVLGRSSPLQRAEFEKRFGGYDMSVREFTAGPAAHVEMIDLATFLPALA